MDKIKTFKTNKVNKLGIKNINNNLQFTDEKSIIEIKYNYTNNEFDNILNGVYKPMKLISRNSKVNKVTNIFNKNKISTNKIAKVIQNKILSKKDNSTFISLLENSVDMGIKYNKKSNSVLELSLNLNKSRFNSNNKINDSFDKKGVLKYSDEGSFYKRNNTSVDFTFTNKNQNKNNSLIISKLYKAKNNNSQFSKKYVEKINFKNFVKNQNNPELRIDYLKYEVKAFKQNDESISNNLFSSFSEELDNNYRINNSLNDSNLSYKSKYSKIETDLNIAKKSKELILHIKDSNKYEIVKLQNEINNINKTSNKELKEILKKLKNKFIVEDNKYKNKITNLLREIKNKKVELDDSLFKEINKEELFSEFYFINEEDYIMKELDEFIKDDISNYKFEIPLKYQMSKKSKVLQEEKRENGNFIKFYENSVAEIITKSNKNITRVTLENLFNFRYSLMVILLLTTIIKILNKFYPMEKYYFIFLRIK